MVSVQHLLDQCRHRTTIVFTNLGRWPDRVLYYDHLELTWDKGVDLKFFRVGRSPSRQVWEAHQPQNTEAYSLDLTHCTRLADVYVTWLTWLDDWEMHRDENLPWRVVCTQPWKRALETHVERSNQKALAHGMPLTSSSICKASGPFFLR
ncbi:uncharacterized protein TNCV_5022361 [Trichonephila clavipes]|nr:uncharacterized protein TNCV_5022361 [Trichonephila clavipes]